MPDINKVQAEAYTQRLKEAPKAIDAVNVLTEAAKAAGLHPRHENRLKNSMGTREYYRDLKERGLANYLAVREAFHRAIDRLY